MISGTGSNNILLKTLEQTYQNTSYSENIREKIKELYTELNNYFNQNEKPSTRIIYISQTLEKVINNKNDNQLKQIVEQIPLGKWGTISDIQYNAHLVRKIPFNKKNYNKNFFLV